MLKTVLLVMIFIMCTSVGRMLTGARKRRMEILGEILAAMRVLRLRMLNSQEPIGILLRKSELFLFRELGNGLWEGANLAECWLRMRDAFVKRGNPLDCLKEEDLEVLDMFFAELGRTGREEQNNLFAMCIARIEEAQNEARSHFADGSKLFTALGALVGVGICVLIV